MKLNLELSHRLCNVCFWTGLLCSNWLCQTEELDEAQTVWPFYLASGVDYISIKRSIVTLDITILSPLFFGQGWFDVCGIKMHTSSFSFSQLELHTTVTRCFMACVQQPRRTRLHMF